MLMIIVIKINDTYKLIFIIIIIEVVVIIYIYTLTYRYIDRSYIQACLIASTLGARNTLDTYHDFPNRHI